MEARARIGIFVAAAALGAFDLGSYAYLKRESVDFVVARREREAPAVTPGVALSWQGQAPGALFGWFAPEPAGTFSAEHAAAFAARLPGRPPGDLLLTAKVSALVHHERKQARRVDVLVNGAPVATWEFLLSEPVEQTARIPPALVRDDGLVRVELRVRDASSAWDAGDGKPRLGTRLVEWRLEPVAP